MTEPTTRGRRTRAAHTARSPKVVRLGIAWVLSSCVACATSQAPSPAIGGSTAERSPLNEFQWAVLTEGSIFLVPLDGYLYPARKSGTGILESMPPQVSVSVAGREDGLTFALHDLVSPHRVDARRWILQLRTAAGWEDQRDYRFDGSGFAIAGRAEPIAVHEFDTIRFRPAR